MQIKHHENAEKTDVILFKTKHKPCDTELQLQLCRKILNKTSHARYLGIKIDENLNWKTNVHDLASKLNGADSVLPKLQHFVKKTLKIYLLCYIPILNKLCLCCMRSYKLL